jgi:two-component system, OmpR family, sensor kinase
MSSEGTGRSGAATGLALYCDPAGRISEVLVDALPLDTRPREGALLSDLVDEGSKAKVGHLLDEIQSHGAAFGWEINAPVEGSIQTLQVGGGATGGRFVILASVSAGGVGRLYEQLMAINNEHANAFRSVMKDHLGALGVGAAKDAELYERITGLNSELANQQRELAKANMELQSLITQRDELLGMAAHDLRNPLGTILNFSQFLIDELGPNVGPDHRQFLATIQSQSRFMLRLVNDLLDISKIEAGKLELDPLKIDLASFVEHSVALNRPLARKKNIELRFETASDLPEVDIDPGRMEQVINNLVTNAIKYSHSGSQVDIQVRADDEGGVVVVRDRGVGIPKSHIDRLFRPFGRVASRGTAGEMSTGLGLAIVRKIVEAHHGSINVESEAGVGSTFRIWLPVTEPPGAG